MEYNPKLWQHLAILENNLLIFSSVPLNATLCTFQQDSNVEKELIYG